MEQCFAFGSDGVVFEPQRIFLVQFFQGVEVGVGQQEVGGHGGRGADLRVLGELSGLDDGLLRTP